MTQQEFHYRVGMMVTTEEFDAINTVYMAADVNKDEFCMYWKKMNRTRIQQATRKAREEQTRGRLKFEVKTIYDIYFKRVDDDTKLCERVMNRRALAVLAKAGIKTEGQALLTVCCNMALFLKE